ncbi:MAG: radical SAM protein [Oligoflexus sp.]
MSDEKIQQSKLTITEIYKSIQGESSYTGWPCAFIRLSGCPLRCRWCDTVYSFKEGQSLSIAEILAQIDDLQVPMVELTGGEPLAQAEAPYLMEQLLGKGYQVLLETGGSEPVETVPRGVHIIMDIKCPDSGMSERNRWENLDFLKTSDELKFVIASQADFRWASRLVREQKLSERFTCLFSPAFGLVAPQQLVEWILADHLPVRLNMQIHKYIWSPRAKGV